MDLKLIEKYIGPIISYLPEPEFFERVSGISDRYRDLSQFAEEMKSAVTKLTEQITNSNEGIDLEEEELDKLFRSVSETTHDLRIRMKSLVDQNVLTGEDLKTAQKYLDNVKPTYKQRRYLIESDGMVQLRKAVTANRDAALTEIRVKAMNPEIEAFEDLLNAAVAQEELEEEGFASETERSNALGSLAVSMDNLIAQMDELNVQSGMKEAYGRIGKLYQRAEERFGTDFTDRLSAEIQGLQNKVFLMKRYADNPSYASGYGFGKDEDSIGVYEVRKGLEKIHAAERDFTKPTTTRHQEIEFDPFAKNRGNVKNEYSLFLKGPKGCDPKSMLEWTTQCAHIFSQNYNQLRVNYTFFQSEKAPMLHELGTAWLKPLNAAKQISINASLNRTPDPEYLEKLVDNRIGDIDNQEILKDINSFNEKYDRYLKSLTAVKVNECFNDVGQRIDNVAAKRELEYGRMAYTHEKDAPFAIAHNMEGEKGIDYVFHMHSGKVDFSASNMEKQLAALKADFKKTDPFWIATNSRQFNDIQTRLSDTLKTFQMLKQNPDDLEISAKAAQQMEVLADITSTYSARKKGEYPRTKKGRDELRFTAASKLTSLAATYVLAPKVKSFCNQTKQLGKPGADYDKMAESFVDALKLLEKFPKQPDLKNLLSLTYANVSRSTAGAAFNEKVRNLISNAPELKNTDLNKLAEHGKNVAKAVAHHKQTLEKASPENQRKVGYRAENESRILMS